jgi:hypothetical protein
MSEEGAGHQLTEHRIRTFLTSSPSPRNKASFKLYHLATLLCSRLLA